MLNDETGEFMFRFNRCSLYEDKELINAAYSAVCGFIENVIKEK